MSGPILPNNGRAHVQDGNERQFRVGVFDCFRGGLQPFCLGAFRCDFVLNYLTAEIIGDEEQNPLGMACLSVVCPSMAATLLRMKIRRFFGMEEDPIVDVFYGTCCTPCVSCQTYNEVKERGY